jgi:hypothetical protein
MNGGRDARGCQLQGPLLGADAGRQLNSAPPDRDIQIAADLRVANWQHTHTCPVLIDSNECTSSQGYFMLPKGRHDPRFQARWQDILGANLQNTGTPLMRQR